MNWVVMSAEQRIDQALQMGAVQDALDIAQSAASQQPGNWALIYRQGLALAALKRTNEAFACYTQALQLNPLSVEVRVALGNAYLQMNDGWTAAAWISDACRVNPHHPPQWLQLAQLLAVQKREAEIEPALLSGLGANPDNRELLQALAERYIHTKRHAEAAQLYPRVVAAFPQGKADSRTHLHWGFSLEHSHQLEASIAQYRHAIALEPDMLEAHIDLSGVLWRLADYAGCLHHAREAERIAPDHAFSQRILGTAHLHVNDLASAEKHLRRALEIQPVFPIATIDLALLLLLAGRFEEGWQVYEKRWADKDRMTRPAFFNEALEWQGPQKQPLQGKRIAIYAEQGLGDVINFIRYATFLQRDGATVFCVIQPDLIPLVETMPGVVCLKPHINIEADYHVALLELPLHYRTDPVRAPEGVPHGTLATAAYFKADDAKRAVWRDKLAPYKDKLKIGITWAGHHVHANHHNRCTPLSSFKAIADIPGVQLISLQKSDGQRYTDCTLESWLQNLMW
jgi:tetratricopeptide (TPR) repeat protein